MGGRGGGGRLAQLTENAQGGKKLRERKTTKKQQQQLIKGEEERKREKKTSFGANVCFMRRWSNLSNYAFPSSTRCSSVCEKKEEKKKRKKRDSTRFHCISLHFAVSNCNYAKRKAVYLIKNERQAIQQQTKK